MLGTVAQPELISSEKLNESSLCGQVSQLLAQHPDTMLQFLPQEIAAYIGKDLGVLVAHPQHKQELAAFAKLYPWPGLNQNGQLLFEFGSWVVPPKYHGQGFGRQVLFATLLKGHQLYPGSQIIGVVEASNQRSEQILLEVGGKLLPQSGWPSNFAVLLQEGAAEIAVIDLSTVIVNKLNHQEMR